MGVKIPTDVRPIEKHCKAQDFPGLAKRMSPAKMAEPNEMLFGDRLKWVCNANKNCHNTECYSRCQLIYRCH